MSTANDSPQPISQACVIPFRRRGDQIEFCLITSLKKERWIFPKGIIDPGETLVETALKEAFEEAGIHGRLIGEPLGSYEDAKWNTTLDVTVLLMEVTQCDEQWLDAGIRRRRWLDAERAAELLSKKMLRKFVRAAVARIAAIGPREENG